jgi:hypothetical protein
MGGKKNTFIFVQTYKINTMTWTSIWYGVAAVFEAIFKLLKALYQVPNIFVWVLIVVLLTYWTLQLRKQMHEAKQNGTRP